MVINNIKYEIIKDDNHTCDEELLKEMMTDYFASYDYIVGDWSYNKLRLKGFNDKSNKNFNKINDFSKLDEYLEKNCAYGCQYFVLKKLVEK